DPARLAREQDAADRQLELAQGEDRGAATFEDSAVASRSASSASPSEPPAPRPAAPKRAPEPESASKRASTSPPAVRPAMLVVPIGTTFAVRLNETLATDQNQVGDPFTATLVDPIVDLEGRVLLPSGAVVRG